MLRERLVVLATTVLVASCHLTSSQYAKKTYDDGKAFLSRRARQAPGEVTQPNSGFSVPPTQHPGFPVTSGPPESEACTAAQCNERGTCFGSKAMPICLCQLGHAGPKCEDSYCDSARDCGGRGWCMGTSTQFTCLCNIGYTGDRCQLEASAAGASGSAIIPTMTPIVAPAPSPAVGSGSVPLPGQQPFPGQGQQ